MNDLCFAVIAAVISEIIVYSFRDVFIFRHIAVDLLQNIVAGGTESHEIVPTVARRHQSTHR